MSISQMNPFVRFAAKTGSLPNSHFTMAYDARLLYILSGEGEIHFATTTYTLKEGTLALYPPGTEYYPVSSDKNPLCFITVNFDYTYEFHDIKNTLFPVPVKSFQPTLVIASQEQFNLEFLNNPLVIQDMYCIQSELCDVVDTLQKDEIYSKELASAFLKTALMKVIQSFSISRGATTIYDEILFYIRNNYNQKLSNSSIAKALGYHPNYLNEVIKKGTQMSLHNFLMHYRVKLAVQIITCSDTPIHEVAYMVGFSNPEHFSTCFKRFIGISPSEYSKKLIV